ncbi:MAG: dihydroorotase, partial [Anaerovoracaceae bacterium]
MKNTFTPQLDHSNVNETILRDFESRFSGSSDILSEKKCIIIPSFVDVHVHLREPGFFYKETIRTGTMAGARSGYSHLFAMPNLNPVPDSLAHLKEELDIIEKDAVISVLPYGSLTVGEKGGQLSDMEEMAPYTAGFSDDGVGLNDPDLMRQAMIRAKKLGKPVVAHCEDMVLRNGGYIHAGEYARVHGHKGISSKSEWKPIERDLKLAEETGCSYHVCHISCAESVEVIRDARARGVDVTCETAPHYLLLSDADLQEDGRFKMNPPIRSERDRQALIEGLLDGTIDMIATDHAPHSAEEKSKGLAASAMGITGLEAAFPVLYTGLVKTGILTLEKLTRLMSVNPRRRFGLAPAEEAMDYSVWEVDTPYTLDPADFVSKGKATPF